MKTVTPLEYRDLCDRAAKAGYAFMEEAMTRESAFLAQCQTEGLPGEVLAWVIARLHIDLALAPARMMMEMSKFTQIVGEAIVHQPTIVTLGDPAAPASYSIGFGTPCPICGKRAQHVHDNGQVTP